MIDKQNSTFVQRKIRQKGAQPTWCLELEPIIEDWDRTNTAKGLGPYRRGPPPEIQPRTLLPSGSFRKRDDCLFVCLSACVLNSPNTYLLARYSLG